MALPHRSSLPHFPTYSLTVSCPKLSISTSSKCPLWEKKNSRTVPSLDYVSPCLTHAEPTRSMALILLLGPTFRSVHLVLMYYRDEKLYSYDWWLVRFLSLSWLHGFSFWEWNERRNGIWEVGKWAPHKDADRLIKPAVYFAWSDPLVSLRLKTSGSHSTSFDAQSTPSLWAYLPNDPSRLM